MLHGTVHMRLAVGLCRLDRSWNVAKKDCAKREDCKGCSVLAWEESICTTGTEP